MVATDQDAMIALCVFIANQSSSIIMEQICRENSITKEQEEKLLYKFEVHTEEELF